MGDVRRVEIIDSKGCSRLFVGFSPSTPSLRGVQSLEPMSPAIYSGGSEPVARSNGPFSGLVICVTGLSKEARKQVMEAAERLGGEYSPNLHPRCTHLVVQSYGGRKFEHAFKHWTRDSLYVVTLGWFVDSVRRNVRLSESLYAVKSVGENGIPDDEPNRLIGFSVMQYSCLAAGNYKTKQFGLTEEIHRRFSGAESTSCKDLALSGFSFYVDPNISDELQNKVSEAAVREGAKLVNKWFPGSNATHVVCEENSVQRYLGHADNLVTPLWVLKTVREKHTQRIVHISADLARQMGMMFENLENKRVGKDLNVEHVQEPTVLKSNLTIEERQKIVDSAKIGVRNRRVKTCQTSTQPTTPSSLLHSICWTVSEPTSAASVYADSSSSEEASESHASKFVDAKADASFTIVARPLTESEKSELIFKNHFLTILFPIDRYGEMGPLSRMYFSKTGFTCLQVLDYIYALYQENMYSEEIDVAIHTDSKHADRLRAVYCSKETAEKGFATFRRIEFLGSRKSFEMLKRVSGDDIRNVYELLLIRA